MGLDITLKKFLTKEESDNMPEPQYCLKRYFHMDSVLRKKLYDMNMEKFIYKITDTFYDIEKYGINDEKYKHIMTKFGDNAYPIHVMEDTSHELYPIYEKMQNFITLADTKIEDVKETDFFTDEELKLIKEKYCYAEPLFVMTNGDGSSCLNLYHFIGDKVSKEFDMEFCPTYEEEVEIYYWSDDIGYQRKGLNGKFYDEFTEDDYYVLTKERMQYVYDNYVNEDYKEYFKEHLLDRFVEGEMFCTFDW